MPAIRANGLEINYEEDGHGRPLVLIMGVGAQLVHWPDGFCDMLVDRGYRVIRLDNRDVGLSSQLDAAGVPPFWRSVGRGLLGLRMDVPYTLSDMAADVAGLIEALDLGRAEVVGISLGGAVAQVLATEHPHRVRTLTSMMSTTGARRYLGRPRAVARLLRPAPKNREEAQQYAIDFFTTVAGPRFPVDEEDVRERAGRAYDRSFNPRGFVRQLMAMLASGNRTKALRRVRVPTLVIHGSADPLIPMAAGRATARAIPGAKLEIIDGLGHHLPSGAWPILVNAIDAHVRAVGLE